MFLLSNFPTSREFYSKPTGIKQFCITSSSKMGYNWTDLTLKEKQMKQAAVQSPIQFTEPSLFWEGFGKTISRVSGWKIDFTLPDDPKMLIIFYPHTSNSDAIHAVLAAFALGLRPNWLIKNEIARPPFRKFFQKLGAIPIERNKNENKVEQIADAIRQADRVILGLSPEGTRSRTEYWRSGFYHIARLANIPIHFGFIDYPSKTVGAAPGFIPSGDQQADMEKIRAFYADKRGKYPERVGPIRFRS